MIIVTGGFGFIGSNIIKELNKRNKTNILVVDDLTNGHKFKNLVNCDFEDYLDHELFFEEFTDDLWENVTQIYHEGAISSTTEWNGKLVMEKNYKFSTKLLEKAIQYNIPFSYASSASVYGNTTHFIENGPLDPLNMYAYSKYLFDKKVEDILKDSSSLIIQGFRYFNVYGNGEEHKENQASPIYNFIKQAKDSKVIKVFEGSENYKRDFVCVEDIAKLKVEMLEKRISGIFNAGTGKAISFMEIAEIISNKTGAKIELVEFPNHLKGHYQEFTQADLTNLNSAFGEFKWTDIKEFIEKNRGP